MQQYKDLKKSAQTAAAAPADEKETTDAEPVSDKGTQDPAKSANGDEKVVAENSQAPSAAALAEAKKQAKRAKKVLKVLS